VRNGLVTFRAEDQTDRRILFGTSPVLSGIVQQPKGVPGSKPRSRYMTPACTPSTDATTTTLVLVSRPERSSLAEADRSRSELADMGVGQRSPQCHD
jgi:hypothetical protein